MPTLRMRLTGSEDDTRAIPLPELDRLWARTDIPLRERALWRLLYDSAARADGVHEGDCSAAIQLGDALLPPPIAFRFASADAEVERNPRARSARLRAVERVA